MMTMSRPAWRLMLIMMVGCALGLAAGFSRNHKQEVVYATGECTSIGTSNCDFFPCQSTDSWGSSVHAVEYRVQALPWLSGASGSSRLKRLSWKDTRSGGGSWPPMVISASWGSGAPYHVETLTVNEDGSTSGSSNIRVWTMNGSTPAPLCDGWTGRSDKGFIGSCIGTVFYGIDVKDEVGAYGCLAGVQLQPTSTSTLKAQDPAQCPDGTNLTPVTAAAQWLSCSTNLNVVPWPYSQ